ncbi:MAG: TA system VapC family ribonuclease toxin [Mycobacteriaceae bacterium]|uniref:TA system VapC family ribonuclease toxin n=1 Tax=Corynebacterium sp. TaxID=1720 RepID=UPI003F96E9C5
MSDLELPDVNVLVALMHPNHVDHDNALAWFSAAERFATTPVTESGFLRLGLNRAVTGVQLGSTDVLGMLGTLRSRPNAVFLPDNSTLSEPLVDLVGLSGHRQVTDLHLVNLAATNNALLVTFDHRIAPTLTTADQSRVRTLP